MGLSWDWVFCCERPPKKHEKPSAHLSRCITCGITSAVLTQKSPVAVGIEFKPDEFRLPKTPLAPSKHREHHSTLIFSTRVGAVGGDMWRRH